MMRRITKSTLLIATLFIAAGLIAAGAGVAHLVSTNNAAVNQTAKDGTSPDFRALLPKQTSIDTLGGWSKLTSPNGDSFFAFNDTVAGVPIRVSQQLLPSDFKNNTDAKINELAKSFRANRTLKAGGEIYVGVNTAGQQSLIFTRNDLLVLIVSEKIVSDDAWMAYLENLV